MSTTQRVGTDRTTRWPDGAPPPVEADAVHGARTAEHGLVALAWLAASHLGERERLERVARVVADALPPSASVGIALGAPWAPEAVVTTGARAAALGAAQAAAGEGPSVSAWTHGGSTRTADLAADPRWPRLAAAARGADVRSALAVLLHADAGAVGVVAAYAAGAAAFTDEDLHTVELLASAAGAALTALRQRAHAEAEAARLTRALASRAVVDQAKGVVMALRGGSADDAFAYLTRLGQTQNVTLQLVARRVVEQARTGTLDLPPRPA